MHWCKQAHTIKHMQKHLCTERDILCRDDPRKTSHVQVPPQKLHCNVAHVEIVLRATRIQAVEVAVGCCFAIP